MLNQQPNKYMENAVLTATPAQLLIMLYDGAIRFSRMAVVAMNNKDFSEANHRLLKSQEIIGELAITLDKKFPIAEDLLKLYDYFLTRLREANLKKEVEPIQEVIQHLTELKETWVQAALSVKTRAGVQYG